MPVKVGERRLIDGQVAEWDGTGWLPVEAREGKPEPEMAPSGLESFKRGFMGAPWGPVATAATIAAPLGLGAVGGAVGGAAGRFVSGAMLKRMAVGAAAGAAAESLPVIGSGKPIEGAKLGAMLGMGQGGVGALWRFGKKRQLIEKIADWAGGRVAGSSVARSAAKRATSAAAPKAEAAIAEAGGGTVAKAAAPVAGIDAQVGQHAREWIARYQVATAAEKKQLVKGLAGKLNYDDMRKLAAYTEDLTKVGSVPPPVTLVRGIPEKLGGNVTSALEENLRALIAQNAARSAGTVSRVVAPTSTSAAQAAAQALQAKIVDMRVRQGFSDAQIQKVLLEKLGKNLRPSEAKAMVRMVLRDAGLAESKIGAMR